MKTFVRSAMALIALSTLGACAHYVPLAQADSSNGDGDAGRPTSHHHHSSGDNHTAIPVLDRDLNPLIAINAALLQPAVDGARPAHDGDGPEYPPKRTRTII